MEGQFCKQNKLSKYANFVFKFKVKHAIEEQSQCLEESQNCLESKVGTPYNVCSVYRGVFSTSRGYHEYIRECSVHRGIP